MENRVIGDFKLQTKLGSGSIGETYLAEHLFIKKLFVLKLLSAENCQDKGLIDRLQRLSDHLQKIEHPHIVKLHSFSCVDGQYFQVFDYVVDLNGKSQNLCQYLSAKKSRMSEDDIVLIIKQVAHALDHLHQIEVEEAPLLHRGLKLSNIFIKKIDRKPFVFVSDVGLNGAIGEGRSLSACYEGVQKGLGIEESSGSIPEQALLEKKRQSLNMSFLQNFAFLSPEQKGGEKKERLTSTSDSYAIGVLAYFLLMGRVPEGIFPLPNDVDPTLKYNWNGLLKLLLTQNPAERQVVVFPEVDSTLLGQRELNEVKPAIEKVQHQAVQTHIDQEPEPPSKVHQFQPPEPSYSQPPEPPYSQPADEPRGIYPGAGISESFFSQDPYQQPGQQAGQQLGQRGVENRPAKSLDSNFQPPGTRSRLEESERPVAVVEETPPVTHHSLEASLYQSSPPSEVKKPESAKKPELPKPVTKPSPTMTTIQQVASSKVEEYGEMERKLSGNAKPMTKKPTLKPSEIKRCQYEEDPGAIFKAETVVAPYVPEKKEVIDIEPILTDMVVIEGGEYYRGLDDGARDERPEHQVSIPSFALDVHPVTNEQFARFLEMMGGEKDSNNNDIIFLKESRIKRNGGKLVIETGYLKHPVVGVSWYGAVAYAKWVGKRLPTEAEWEVAAACGKHRFPYPYGETIEPQQANFFSSDTTPVMSYPANQMGLFDMAGNVYEWCEDWYAYNYYETSQANPSNPTGPAQGVYRVLRGGCWKSLKDDLRTSGRHRNNPGTMNRTYGFRCAADVQDS
ncbi:MAG: Hercynine oxygenase [Chlamydiia bacterium]|nr:Hercynine oxygenase [Chlamydiia bacterium]